jgi:aminopeptidase N
MKQIIAIGGGGFGREIKDLKIEKYIVEQCSKENPSICFIPTATGDDAGYIENFYKAFDSLKCRTSHIDFFKRTIDLKEHILKQDIIFVGGGNTKSMLAVWREWGLDEILFDAYNRGVIMSGVSAGAICWFENGITDSWKDNQSILPCLSFVKGNCCPHYDEEPERIPFVSKILKNKEIDNCLAIEGFCALHVVDDLPKHIVSFGNESNCHFVSYKNNEISHNPVTNTKRIEL